MISFLIFGFMAAPAAAVQVATATAQGQALHARIEWSAPQEPQKVRMEFLEKETPCYPAEKPGLWDCFAAVPADAEPGGQSVKIKAGGRTLAKTTVRIAETAFPVEELRLTKDKKDLMSETAERNEEVKRIRAALAMESEKKFWKARFAKPVEGAVESLYGEKRSVDGKPLKSFHRGLDWAARRGTPIAAANDGTVLLAGPFIEEGNMVMLDHGQGVISAYLHLSAIGVKDGQTVKRGDILGQAGSTGVSNSSHLHFGLYIHSIPIDPLFWLSRY